MEIAQLLYCCAQRMASRRGMHNEPGGTQHTIVTRKLPLRDLNGLGFRARQLARASAGTKTHHFAHSDLDPAPDWRWSSSDWA